MGGREGGEGWRERRRKREEKKGRESMWVCMCMRECDKCTIIFNDHVITHGPSVVTRSCN